MIDETQTTLCVPKKEEIDPQTGKLDRYFQPSYDVLGVADLGSRDPKTQKRVEDIVDKLVALEGSQLVEVQDQVKGLPWDAKEILQVEIEKSIERSATKSQAGDIDRKKVMADIDEELMIVEKGPWPSPILKCSLHPPVDVTTIII